MYFKTVPPIIRSLLPSNLEWEILTDRKEIFLTFDDGPIPDVTHWVLDQLDRVGAKATFFCVGDNVGKHPAIFAELEKRGHRTGNHTFNHLQAWRTDYVTYMDNTRKCADLVPGNLFRPPHGQITPRLAKELGKNYRLIMWSLLTQDYDINLNPEKILKISLEKTKPGSIVVFHDSVKAWKNLEYTLPRFIDHFSGLGYSFRSL
ncbi:MAG: polysaccharide deacetylase family protein [Bacteroidetes bacterium]|nr:polysaccharide deacetylase family protein [Bacteroidota bacterium]